VNAHDFKIKLINGEEISLSKFKGKKILFVNTASECGYTPQYKGLQELSEKFKDKLVVLGLPSNDFGAQEPGSNSEIAQFCEANFKVTFPMSEKIKVVGPDRHPLYKFFAEKSMEPEWNFVKYLVDENGSFISYFHHKVEPLSEEITHLI
jgi:glutathione peroxidase